MCGITAYVGEAGAVKILLSGLSRLEYRGYDSVGVATIDSEKLVVRKQKGSIAELKSSFDFEGDNSHVGIGHTRWATHGGPSTVNAHPHTSMDGRIAVVHNGIIENYVELKQLLEEQGFVFVSDTDTEVIAHLLQWLSNENSFADAMLLATEKLTGAFGIAAIHSDFPDNILVARMGSPLVVGVADDGCYVASDPSALIEYTHKVWYLEDGDVANLHKDGSSELLGLNAASTPQIIELDMKLHEIEKGGYDHFMLKEIMEQPRAIRDSIRGRIDLDLGEVHLGGIRDFEDVLVSANRIILVACGTSWHAALTAEYYLETLAKIPVEVEYASEFRYREPLVGPGDVVIAVSQSGETADTLAAVHLAKSKRATVLGVCNVVGSSIARETVAGIYTHAGPEIGVASTKAFTTQLAVFLLLAVRLAQLKEVLSPSSTRKLLNQISSLPDMIEQVLQVNDQVKGLASSLQYVQNMFYLGRGVGFPTALEGALKLKEISYIHAEGYPAAEMKHGPLALIETNLPVIFIATSGRVFEKVLSNMEEVKARSGRVIALATEGDSRVNSVTDEVIALPACNELLTPFLASVPLQLLAYHIAVMRGCAVDRPRNLAKSVTVE